MCIARYSTMIPAYVIIAMGREGWCTLARQWLSRRALFFPPRARVSTVPEAADVERARFVPGVLPANRVALFNPSNSPNAAWRRDSSLRQHPSPSAPLAGLSV